LIGSARGDSVWLFALDGTLPQAEPNLGPRQTYVVPPTPTNFPAVAAPAARTAAVGVSAANREDGKTAETTENAENSDDTENGKLVYEQTCVICHGPDGLGGHGGGAPLDRVASMAAAMQALEAGRNTMPSFAGVLTPAQIRDVSAYVVERLHAPPSGAH
jgi:mono/diheme cytochrome c family protein